MTPGSVAPGPGGPEMLRAGLGILRDPLAFIARMRDRYGDVVELPIPGTPTFLISSGAGAAEMLVGGARTFDKDTVQYRSLSAVTGEGLLTARTAAWREPRRVVQPAFAHTVLPALGELVREEAAATLAAWHGLRPGAVVDVEAAMLDLTLRVVGRALFGDDLGDTREALATATLEALDVVIRRSRVPVAPPLGWPTPANRRLARSLRALDAAVDRLVATRRAAGGGGLLIDLLLASPLPARAVRDQIVTFLVAGHETAATGLTWAFWLLADAPGEQDRLAALSTGRVGGVPPAAAGAGFGSERDASAGGASAGDVGAGGVGAGSAGAGAGSAGVGAGSAGAGSAGVADAGLLPPFAKACADEALRLYPPAWVVSRRAEADAEVGGFVLPARSLGIVSPYVLQRDPRVWPEPEVFRPQRFLAGLSRSQRLSYLPFGAGPRLCIGRDFARWEMATVLTQLCGAMIFERPTDRPPAMIPGVTLRPARGMPLRLTPRSIAVDRSRPVVR